MDRRQLSSSRQSSWDRLFGRRGKRFWREVVMASGPQAPYRLRLEYLENPLGIDEVHPRFSWYLDDARPGARQSAYQIQVFTSLERLERGKADLWDSGRVPSADTGQVAYAGAPLKSRKRCFWRVRSFDGR